MYKFNSLFNLGEKLKKTTGLFHFRPSKKPTIAELNDKAERFNEMVEHIDNRLSEIQFHKKRQG
jgi:hypothetical protein